MMPLLAFHPLLAAASVAPTGVPSFMIFGYLALFVGIYFLLIAPQRKKQKEHEKMLTALQSGDEVVTTGGIYATITNVKDDRFVVRIGETQKIEIGKGFVHSVVKRAGEEKK